MFIAHRAGLFLSVALVAFVSSPLAAWGQVSVAQSHRPAGTDDVSVRLRADTLIKKMSAEQKIGQLSQLFVLGPSTSIEKRVQAGELGSLLFLMDPAEINRFQRMAVEQSPLHIPLLFGLDVIHGFRTVLPVPIALSASWDPALVESAQAVAADEASAAGINWTFAPMVDIARDPRWGRIVEGAGEDPYLGSAMAAAQVRGFQGSYIGAPNHIMACTKHFAGYGAAEGGRDYDAADISDEQLWNVYLPPFHSAVDAGTATVMSAYMDLNGVPATGNRWLLHDVLRTQWGFNGFVVSDADAVRSLKKHGYAQDLSDAAHRAFMAGVNMEMALGSTAYEKNLPDLLKAGKITEAELEEAVRPILEMKIKLGLFEHPYVDETKVKQVLTSPAHRQEARLAAERSAVLLRNESKLLPLKSSSYKSVAVIGPLADSQLDTTGPWVFANDNSETVTVLAGIRQAAGAGSKVDYAPGVQIARKFASPFDVLSKGPRQTAWTQQQSDDEFSRAVTLAKGSDLSIMVLGEGQNMAGEQASESTLNLPGRQEELLEAVVATGTPVVLVLMNGRPLNLSWANSHVPAILDIWYPGTEGGTAAANLLFGKAVPGGKLPFTWPRNVGQVPIFYAHNMTQAPENQSKRYWNEESTPLYPFGYGLSYASFKFSGLKVSKNEVSKGEALGVSAQVENSSDVAGDEVVQLYIHQQYGSSSRPVRELKGFRRVSLKPHETQTVEFSLSKDDLTYWSSAMRSPVQDASDFEVWVGGDSDADLKGSFTVRP
jgi:beta-glucosidase